MLCVESFFIPEIFLNPMHCCCLGCDCSEKLIAAGTLFLTRSDWSKIAMLSWNENI